MTAGSLWFPFGFDGIAGDTRDAYPTNGDGGANFASVLSPLLGSHMKDEELVFLDGFLITNNSNGGNLIIKRASDASELFRIPCPIPSRQPMEVRFGRGLRIAGLGGFTVASDQSLQILSAIAWYSFEES
jgi:hypothetical protein